MESNPGYLLLNLFCFINLDLCQSGFVSIQICINLDFFIKALLEEFFPINKIKIQPYHPVTILAPLCEGRGKGSLEILKVRISDQKAAAKAPSKFSKSGFLNKIRIQPYHSAPLHSLLAPVCEGRGKGSFQSSSSSNATQQAVCLLQCSAAQALARRRPSSVGRLHTNTGSSSSLTCTHYQFFPVIQ